MDAIAGFRKLGLSEYQARALVHVFFNQDSSAEQIATSAAIPITKVYAILAALQSGGIIRCTLERPKRYFTPSAKDIVDAIIKKHEELLELVHEEGRRTLAALTATKSMTAALA